MYVLFFEVYKQLRCCGNRVLLKLKSGIKIIL